MNKVTIIGLSIEITKILKYSLFLISFQNQLNEILNFGIKRNEIFRKKIDRNEIKFCYKNKFDFFGLVSYFFNSSLLIKY